CGGIIGAAVEAIAADTIDLGTIFSFNNHIGANDVGGLPTTAGTIAMRVSGAGKDLAFVNSDASLIVGTLAVSAGSLTLPCLSGVTTNGGELDLAVVQFTPPLIIGDPFQMLTLQQPVNANNGSTILGASPG